MKILLVDDDALFRALILKTLSEDGHQITAACDGAEAIKYAKGNNFDLVITDIFMPKKDGMDVIREIRKIRPATKILTISSNEAAGYTSSLKISEAHGSDGSLRKPFSPVQLREKIKEIAESVARFGS